MQIFVFGCNKVSEPRKPNQGCSGCSAELLWPVCIRLALSSWCANWWSLLIPNSLEVEEEKRLFALGTSTQTLWQIYCKRQEHSLLHFVHVVRFLKRSFRGGLCEMSPEAAPVLNRASSCCLQNKLTAAQSKAHQWHWWHLVNSILNRG